MYSPAYKNIYSLFADNIYTVKSLFDFFFAHFILGEMLYKKIKHYFFLFWTFNTGIITLKWVSKRSSFRYRTRPIENSPTGRFLHLRLVRQINPYKTRSLIYYCPLLAVLVVL
jgi:hypothetical protein